MPGNAVVETSPSRREFDFVSNDRITIKDTAKMFMARDAFGSAIPQTVHHTHEAGFPTYLGVLFLFLLIPE
jgi:hypothetical protein